MQLEDPQPDPSVDQCHRGAVRHELKNPDQISIYNFIVPKWTAPYGFCFPGTF